MLSPPTRSTLPDPSSPRSAQKAFDLLLRRDYKALRARSGVAPVSIQSDKTRWEVCHLAVQHELRNALYHWARVAAQRDPLSARPATAPSGPMVTPMDARAAHRRRPARNRPPAPCSGTAPSTTRSAPWTSSPPEHSSNQNGRLNGSRREVWETRPSPLRPAHNRRRGTAFSRSWGNRSPSHPPPRPPTTSHSDFPGTALSSGYPAPARRPPSLLTKG